MSGKDRRNGGPCCRSSRTRASQWNGSLVKVEVCGVFLRETTGKLTWEIYGKLRETPEFASRNHGFSTVQFPLNQAIESNWKPYGQKMTGKDPISWSYWYWVSWRAPWRLVRLLVGGLEHLDYFSIYWESQSQLTFIFFRGVETTNQIKFTVGITDTKPRYSSRIAVLKNTWSQ
jgi:hypothetical protein